MTAISLGRFLRGVAIPSDFGSILTMAVDMPRIMTQMGGPRFAQSNRSRDHEGAVCCKPNRSLTVAALIPAPSVLQLETQTDIRLIELRNRTPRLGVLHRLLKRLLASAGHLGLQLQMTLRDRKTIARSEE